MNKPLDLTKQTFIVTITEVNYSQNDEFHTIAYAKKCNDISGKVAPTTTNYRSFIYVGEYKDPELAEKARDIFVEANRQFFTEPNAGNIADFSIDLRLNPVDAETNAFWLDGYGSSSHYIVLKNLTQKEAT